MEVALPSVVDGLPENLSSRLTLLPTLKPRRQKKILAKNLQPHALLYTPETLQQAPLYQKSTLRMFQQYHRRIATHMNFEITISYKSQDLSPKSRGIRR